MLRLRNWEMAFPEGVLVTREQHLLPGQLGHYDRLVVQCPRHKVKKTRAFDVKSAVRLGLGDAEPYAFLGAWLRQCESCPTSTAHKSFVPTSEEVKSYVVAQKWQLPSS